MTADLTTERVSEMQVPIRLRSGQAFGSAEKRFAQDDRFLLGERIKEQPQVLRLRSG
jgi:hypothetical protein